MYNLHVSHGYVYYMYIIQESHEIMRIFIRIIRISKKRVFLML